MSNDLGSSSWAAMDHAISTLARPGHAALCRRRHRDAVVLLPSDEGDLAVRAGVGGVMGDPFM
eukprot:5977061-Pyramimonas_sp.AAC.1